MLYSEFGEKSEESLLRQRESKIFTFISEKFGQVWYDEMERNTVYEVNEQQEQEKKSGVMGFREFPRPLTNSLNEETVCRPYTLS